MSKDNSGPAFPEKPSILGLGISGLTKREWFAGMAMTVANLYCDNKVIPEMLSKNAYIIADAMLKAGEGER